MGGGPCEVFTFRREIEREDFIAAMLREVRPRIGRAGPVPAFARAHDGDHDGPDRFLVAIRMPDGWV